MSINEQISRIQSAKQNIKQALIDKGVAVGDERLDEYGALVEGISSGGNTLKTLLDNTKLCQGLFMYYKGNNLSDLIKYNDTENVTDFSYMYNSCSKATSFPELNTSNGTEFSYMYCECSSATSLPQLNTSKGTNFAHMYDTCSSVTSFPQVDTSKANNFSSMYESCSSATSLPQLNTSKGTNFNSMFYGCYEVKKIDISSFNISSTSYTLKWCYECYSLKAVVIRSFGTKYTLNSNSFYACYHILGTTDATYNPNGDKDGYIYVPRNMIETLSSATNWSTYATQFRALEDYTKDGTTTGEFDDEKAGL